MNLIKKVKDEMINIRPASEFDFINNTDSFQVIYQYFLNKTFICKRISFDENGNYLHSWLLDSVSTNSSVQTDSYYYLFIASSNKNKFGLFKSSIDTELNVLNINYRFFSKHTETANTQTLPFYFKLSAISNIVLDNDNLMLAISTYKDSAYQLSMYKINLTSDTSINSIRQILNGRLIDQSINISEKYNRLLISAIWTLNERLENNGIYIWQLNKDLSDAANDTIIENNMNENSAIAGFNAFKMQGFIKTDRTINFIVLPNNKVETPSSYTPPDPTQYLNNYLDQHEDGSIPPPIYISQHDADSSSSVSNATPVIKTQKDERLISLEYDNHLNLKSSQIFTQSIEPGFFSSFNTAEVFNSNSGFNILFDQLYKKSSTYGYIKLQSNNSYQYNQVIQLHLKGETDINESVQINPNTIIFPGVTNNMLMFVEIQFN